jgi:hypothetical protein
LRMAIGLTIRSRRSSTLIQPASERNFSQQQE